jgi:Tol biopolymer transport system component
MSVLSDKQIFQEYEKGNIVISPFNPQHVNNCSYDVTLAEQYYRGNKNSNLKYYNPWNENDVKEYWSQYETATVGVDGSKFIISGPVKDILVVTKDGEITQLTDLRSLTPNQVKPTGYSINRYSWSPDGGRIGFLLNYYENNSFVKGTYVILDMSSKRMVDTCISLGTYPSDRLGITDEAVWSPDGRYAVIKANRTESHHFDVLLLDTENGFAMKITDNLEPIGWMVSSNGN